MPMDEHFPSRAFREAASWRLAANLIRRHPRELLCLETHPGGGQYDCLTLVARNDQSSIHTTQLNREGSLAIHTKNGGADALRNESIWADLARTSDLASIVNEIERHAGLAMPSSTPAATDYSVSIRFIAAFLSHSSIGRLRWEARSGYVDTSGYGGGVRREWFDMFPGAAERLRSREREDFLSEPAYRFWFLVETDDEGQSRPRLAIEATHSTAWDESDVRYDLMDLYRTRRRIWNVVSQVADDLLP